MSALDAPTIQKLYNHLLRGEEDRAPLSPKTIKDLHGVLHRALQQAVQLGMIRANPASVCKPPRVEKPAIHPLADDNVSKFLSAIHGDPCEAVFQLGLFTGMRQGELLGLMWECVNFSANTILVDKQLQRCYEKGRGYRFLSPKNGKSRFDLRRAVRHGNPEWTAAEAGSVAAAGRPGVGGIPSGVYR